MVTSKTYNTTNQQINSIISETPYIPKLIQTSYQDLIQLLNNDEIYGALIKTKDLFELTIKLPLVILLSYVSNKLTEENLQSSDFLVEYDNLHSKLRDFIHYAIEYKLSLGHWEAISGEINQYNIEELFPNDSKILESL